MTMIEFVGGPVDGKRQDVEDRELFGRVQFLEPRRGGGPSVWDRLRAGERVLADDVESADFIRHVYSRTERRRDGAVVYVYVVQEDL